MNINIIVLGLSPTGKYVAREGHAFGATCYGFDRQKGPGYYSRYFHHAAVITEAGLVEKLEREFIPSGQEYFVCPTSDEWVKFIAETPVFRHPNLKVSPGLLDGSYQELSDKSRLEALASRLSLYYPRSLKVVAGEAVPDLTGWPFPLFCKPADRTGLAHVMKGSKGWIIQSAPDLKAVTNQEALKGTELLVQEIIEGPESDIKVLGMVSKGQDPDAGRRWTGAKVRQYPTGFGSASYLVQEPCPELERIARKLIEATEYDGFFALEVKYSSRHDRWYIIEVNTRPSLWWGATTTSNTQLIGEWINSFGTPRVPLGEPLHDRTVVWQYYYKDLMARRNGSTGQAQGAYPATFPVLKSYAVWDSSDPKPFFFDLLNGARKLVSRSLD